MTSINTVVENTTTNTVEITTAGPQGPAAAGFIFNGDAKVDKSLVYYDSSSGEFKADDTWTISTIVKGGDF